MRAKQIIDRYRDFAARTHMMMGAFALVLIFAIIVLMIITALPSQASFLTAEARNVVTMVPTGDTLLVATVALVFFAVLMIKILDHRNRAR